MAGKGALVQWKILLPLWSPLGPAEAPSSTVLVAVPKGRDGRASRAMARVAWCSWVPAGSSLRPWSRIDLVWDAMLGPRDRQRNCRTRRVALLGVTG